MELIPFDYESTVPQLGAILDEPNSVYHGHDAISNSKLSVFRKRRYLYYRKYVKKDLFEEVDKEYFLIGQAAHTLILEGIDVFNETYKVAPEDAPKRPLKKREYYVGKIQANTEEALTFWEKFDYECEGFVVLTDKQWTGIKALKDSVFRNEVAEALLSEGVAEVSFRVDMGWTLAQVRADKYIHECSVSLAAYLNDAYPMDMLRHVEEGDSIVTDLKSCATLTEDDRGSFQRGFGDHEYYVQDALYREVIGSVMHKPLDHFFFIAGEKQEPFESAVWCTETRDLDLAVDGLKYDLQALKNCHETKNWFSFPVDQVIPIGIPGWKRKKAEERIRY